MALLALSPLEIMQLSIEWLVREGLQNPRATLLPGALRNGDDGSHAAS
jgi:hypothetical protein